jgi:hypothetical protein
VADLFKALSGGLSRFVLSWILPSAVAVGVFVLIVLPEVRQEKWAPAALDEPADGLAGAMVFTLVVVLLAVLFAFASLPVYRFLEGYTLPKRLARVLRKRRVRDWHRLRLLAELEIPGSAAHGLGTERRSLYPEREDDVLPTRLGNALKALENYGDERFGLDSQTFWYEMQAVVSDRLRRDLEDTRSAVDFFVSLMAHAVLLACVCLVAAPLTGSWAPAILAIVAAASVPAAYQGAVANMVEWRYAVQALINTTRPQLAQSLGLQFPEDFETEREMWQNFAGLVYYGADQGYLRWLDGHRLRYSRLDSA